MWLVNRTRSAKLNQNTSDTSILSFASRFICRYLFVDGIPQIMLLFVFFYFIDFVFRSLGSFCCVTECYEVLSIVLHGILYNNSFFTLYLRLVCVHTFLCRIHGLHVSTQDMNKPESFDLNLKKRISLNILDLIQLWQQFGLSSSLVSFSLTDSVLSKWVTSL